MAHQWLGYSPLYLIKHDKLELLESSSSTMTIQAIKNRQVEVGSLTLDEAINLAYQGYPIKIFIIADYSSGGDGIVVKPWIKSFKDLEGKKIAVEYSSLGGYHLIVLSKMFNFSLSKLTIVDSVFAEHEDIFNNPDVAAIVTFEPAITRLKNRGGVVLADSSQYPNKIIDVIVYNNFNNDLESNDLLKYVYKEWFVSVKDIKDGKDDAFNKLSKYLDTNPNELKEVQSKIVMPSQSENIKIMNGLKHGEVVSDICKSLKETIYKTDNSFNINKCVLSSKDIFVDMGVYKNER